MDNASNMSHDSFALNALNKSSSSSPFLSLFFYFNALDIYELGYLRLILLLRQLVLVIKEVTNISSRNESKKQ